MGNLGKEEVGHKPGSVLAHWGLKPQQTGQLSIWDTCYQIPLAVHHRICILHGVGKKPTLSPPTLLPTGVYRANISRCCWCALTAPLHPYSDN